MKKTLLTLAWVGLGINAHAQSSVTLYGRIDSGVEYQTSVPNSAHSSSSRLRVESGDLGSNWLGMKGVEDLGGGNIAVFQLEDGLNLANGTSSGGKAFSRIADVGLSDDTYGTILLGNQLWLSSNTLWVFDPLCQSDWSSASLLRGRNWPITSNSVTWESPTWSRLNIITMDTLGNQTRFNAGTLNPNGTTLTPGRSDGIAVTYTTNRFELIGMFDEMRDGNGSFSDVFAYSQEYSAGMNLYLGNFKLQGVYQASHANAVLAGAPTLAQQEWAAVTYTVNRSLSVIGAAYHVDTNGSVGGAGHASLYTLVAKYHLSKRTVLGFQFATVHNSSGADFGLKPNYPVAGSEDPLPGHSQSGMYLSLQHAF